MKSTTPTPPNTLNLLRVAAELVTEGPRHGSPSMVMRRINQDLHIGIGFETARALLTDLFVAGIVGPFDREKLAYPVLLDRDAARTALSAYIQSGTTDWWTLYECPQCCRVAAWTDGRKVSAGDEVDEFWCQTCGAEVPLTSCTIVAATQPATATIGSITIESSSVQMDNGENLRDLAIGDSVDLRPNTGHAGLWIAAGFHGSFQEYITLLHAEVVEDCASDPAIVCKYSGTRHAHPVDLDGKVRPRPPA
jgi:hypothetical protein